MACYANPMPPTNLVYATNLEVTTAFVIRLTWEVSAGHWRILLKPVNGEEARLFSDVESALLYLETQMLKQIQQANSVDNHH